MQKRILLVAISFLVLLGVSFLSALPAHAVIYVSNASGDSITTWPNDTTGNIAPTTNIVGAFTNLSNPFGVAVDGSWIYVADYGDNSVDVFPINADGDAAPTRSIQGAATTLSGSVGVAVDGSWIYVANRNNNSIDVFPIDADGNAAPTRSIQGASTTLNLPFGVAVDGSWIYVANDLNDSVDVFPIDADGNAAPTRSIQGAATTLNTPAGIAVDGSWIYVANQSNNSVAVFPIDADGDAAPTRSIQGAATTLNTPNGVAVDGSWIYVANYLNDSVAVFPINATGDVAPTRSIQGANTTLNYPGGIAVTQAGTVDLPETGQTTCYDASGVVIPCAGTGQDGDILAGVAWPSPRFTDNGNGTMTDNLTGLMWLKDANCANTIGYDPDATGNGSMAWQNALDYAAGINDGTHNISTCAAYTAGYTDWRLPNINEIESLINAEEANPATWLNAQGFTNVQTNAYYWSSSTYAVNTDNAWVFNNNVYIYNKTTYNLYVWPVRAATTPPAEIWKTGQTMSYATGDDGDIQAGVAWPSPRFTDNSDSTVMDNLTGLIWLQDANCIATHDTANPGSEFDNDGTVGDGAVTWQHALDFVAGINSGTYSDCGAGYIDWRLSNGKELHSLTDFSLYNPALPSGNPFVNVQSIYYWSSSTSAVWTGYAWYVRMYNGLVYANPKTDNGFVWPVRGGCTASFTDVPTGYWARGFIKTIACNGITTGYGDGTYRPANTVTRKQMAAFIIRAVEGEPAADYCGTTDPFPDVPYSDWACKYIKRLVELGITTGCGGGDYCPDDNTTRKQMAAFIIRAVEGDPAADYCGTTDPFPDVPYGDWACKFIKRLVELNITTGCEGGANFCPDDNTTRAQMAAFLVRAFLGMP